jgi:peptidoglycan/LPS O-acetylase OafA/YrhL
MAGTSKLSPLTSLRFLAAASVFMNHNLATFAFGETFNLGYAGVCFFFVLSGFILIYNYGERFTGGAGAADSRAFYVARFARVYPLHVLTLCVAAALFPILHASDRILFHYPPPATFQAALAQIALVQSWFFNRDISGSFNNVAWTISDEEFFYLVFPLLAWFVMSKSAARVRIIILFATVLSAGIACAIRFSPAGDPAEGEAAASALWMANIFPPLRLFDFIVGMSLGAILLKSPRPVNGETRSTAYECLALLAVVATFALSPLIDPPFRYDIWFVPCFGLAIYTFAHSKGPIARALSHPWLVYLGELSFAFYMLHEIVIRTWFWQMGGTKRWAGLFVCFFATLILSAATYHGIERRLRERIRRSLAAPVPPERSEPNPGSSRSG